MKKFNLLSAALIAVLVLSVYSCGMIGGSDYLSAVPKDVAFAFKVNVGSLLDKSQVLEDKYITGNLELLTDDMSRKSKKLFEKIIENPEESGIDVHKDVVFAMSDIVKEEFVAVMAVKDHNKIQEVISVINDETGGDIILEQEGDIYYIEENGVVYVAFDASKLVIAEDAIDYMELEKDEQAVSQKVISEWLSAGDDASMMFNFGELVKYIYKSGMNEGFDLSICEDAVFIASGNSVDGSLLLSMETIGNDKLMEYAKKVYVEPEGEHFKYIPANAIGAFAGNLSKMDENLKLMGEMSPQMNGLVDILNKESGIDVAEKLSKLNGDITIAMLPFENTKGEMIPQFMGMVSVEDNTVFDAIKPYLTNLTEVESGVYALGLNISSNYDYNYETGRGSIITKSEGYDYYFGCKDDVIFIMPENIYKDGGLKKLSENFSDNEMSKMLKKTGLVLCVPALFEEIFKNYEDKFDDGEELVVMQNLKKYSNFAEYVSLNAVSPTEVEVKIELSNKDENALKQVKDLIVNLAKAFGGY